MGSDPRSDAAPSGGDLLETAAAGPVADTAYGKVRGLERDGIKIFLGVPYGADTGGRNRWLPPQPAAPWTGVRECVDYGPAPPQILPMVAPMPEETDMAQQGPVGEDCLRINVYTPAVGAKSGTGRAVMVWFHGGIYSAGSGNSASYDGVNLCQKQDVVFVTVTHRLNHFGFLYLGDLFGDAYADSANVGLLDCVAAMKWIRENIANFGGDPERVLAFGQSGGAGKVSFMLGMPSAAGLFNRAATHSGGAGRAMPKPAAAANAKRLVDALGVNTLAQLQDLPWQAIVDAGVQNPGAGGYWPVLDGRSLPADVFLPSASPLAKDVPLIALTTETEMASWGAAVGEIDEQALLGEVVGMTRLTDADARQLIEIYRAAYPGRDNAYIGQLILSQWTFNDLVLAQTEVKAQQAADGGAPVYFLYYAHHLDVRGGVLHSPHCSEIPYVLDSLKASAPLIGTVTPGKQALADKISAYWANFAKTGDPNGVGLPQWPEFDLQTRSALGVDPAGEIKPLSDPWGNTRNVVAEYKAKAAPPPPGVIAPF